MESYGGDITTPAPGLHGPADTTDPTVIAHTVNPHPGTQALASGTVNSIVTTTPTAPARDTTNDRYEEYDVQKPNGTTVTVIRNIETGETRIKEGTD